VSKVRVTVLSDGSAPSLVQALIPAFAAAVGIPAEDERRLGAVVEKLVGFVLDNAYPDDDLGEIEVTLEVGDGSVQVVVHDWGLPLTSAGGEFGPLPEPLAALAPDARDVLLTNLGSDGKRLTAEVAVRSGGEGPARWHHIDAVPRRAPAEGTASDAIEVRAAIPQDAEAIAQLLYENYHLSYVHADFYRPRYLMAALASGGLLSTIALHDGRVIGHSALMPLPGVSSAESGAAVVHSAYRGLGVFGRLSEHTLDTAIERGLASVFGDAVTIHPFSQRVERSNGAYETALQLGMVPAQTTMRGLGGEGPRRRTATLRSYRVFDEQPRQVALPDSYRELLEGLYTNVGLAIEARTRPAPFDGEALTVEIDEPRSLGFLRLRRVEGEAGSAVKGAVHHLLSQHVDVAYADVDLMAVADVNQATVELNELGFFVAGLVLHGRDGHDYLRLQLLDSEEVELEDVICDSTFAETLRHRVLDDKARVRG
jgi:GNAT superfamily N-acetyltransferase/anti-sigma regulatory factor (Ser/Thr protein kinase)